MKWVIGLARVVAAYLIASSLLHFWVFPEPIPPAEDRPRTGDRVELPGGSTFTFLMTRAESAGEFMSAEWEGRPGAGIATHVHPSQQVRFRITAGALEVVQNGERAMIQAGGLVTFEPGDSHSWKNGAGAISRGVYEIRPAGMSDFVFLQMHRAFGGEASEAETLLQTALPIGRHGQHVVWPGHRG